MRLWILADPRPIRTRFRFGSGRSSLTSPHPANSPDHSSIGTPLGKPLARQHPSTACRHTVSVSLSLPSRGAFHLSLTVLVHYRSPKVFSLGQWSAQLPTLETFRVVLGESDGRSHAFGYEALTLYGGPFQAPSPSARLSRLPRGPSGPHVSPHNPRPATADALCTGRVWALPVSLATTQGISFSSSRY
jgi:hypothetical protein